MKKILIVSNNVLSTQNNNGKTLLSFFKDEPNVKLAQIYLSSESLEDVHDAKYYRISDRDVLRSLFFRRPKAGSELIYKDNFSGIFEKKSSVITGKSLKNSDSARLIRELVWRFARIDHDSLSSWVSKFSPDLIFFCAGDSLFAYDIYSRVCSHAPYAKKVVYVTDDYIMPRKKLAPSWWLRKSFVYSKMRKAVQKADVFVTISECMRSEYKKRFFKDSIIAFNMSENIKIEDFKKEIRSDLLLVYAGGLHFKRWQTLAMLASALKVFNIENNRSVLLKIYSHQTVHKSVQEKIEIHGSSVFCGSLDASGVQYALNNADILVHVESFSSESIESTRLSISTKIAEYISVGNRVLAIGPDNVASMRFLAKHACCVSFPDELTDKLNNLLSDKSSCAQDFEVLECQMAKNKNDFKLHVIN